MLLVFLVFLRGNQAPLVVQTPGQDIKTLRPFLQNMLDNVFGIWLTCIIQRKEEMTAELMYADGKLLSFEFDTWARQAAKSICEDKLASGEITAYAIRDVVGTLIDASFGE